METKDLCFDLPQELIARWPSRIRGEDRLLCVNRRSGDFRDMYFSDFPDMLEPGSVLVLNDSKVRKARVFAESESGGRVELLFLGRADEVAVNQADEEYVWKAVCGRLKRRRVGEKLFAGGIRFEVEAVGKEGTVTLRSDRKLDEDFFEQHGHVPLPPYMKRGEEALDEARYQTVYARPLGSAAAPTAGLHYTAEMLDRIRCRGIKIAFVTLHVGLGTFLPVRERRLEDHVMHSEQYEVGEECALSVNAALKDGRRVIASGTTSLRCLESAFSRSAGEVVAGSGETSLFITPGYKFNVAGGLLTNFHTPGSTLMALVAAFSSLEKVKRAYAHAVEEKYRFFSYGDATYWY